MFRNMSGLPRALAIGASLFAVYYVLSDPHAAGDTVHQVFGLLEKMANQLTAFAKSVAD